VTWVRFRKRTASLLIGAVLVFLMGTNAQAGWLLVIAAVFVGAVLTGALLPVLGLRGLHAELLAPEEADQGEASYVEVHLRGPRHSVRWGVRVIDDHLAATETFVPVIRAQERVEVTTARAPTRRGRHTTTHAEVRTAAPFGVAERRRRLPVEASTLVLPHVVPLGTLPFVEPVGTREAAIHTLPRRGGGPEYLGIREYRVGDSMRHVHWPSTARHGSVMVREFEEERTRRVVIVVDTERDADPHAGSDAERDADATPLDRCCTVAASIAVAALAHGHGARLVAAMPGGGIDIVSRADERDVLRWLAELTPSGRPFAEVIAALGSDVLRGAETVILTMPAWGGAGAGLAEVVAGLGVRVPRVVAVPVGASSSLGDRDLEGTAAALREAGAQSLAWPHGRDLAVSLGLAPEEPAASLGLAQGGAG